MYYVLVKFFSVKKNKPFVLDRHNTKQDVFVKHNAPDNYGQFQRRPRSQGQIF